MPPQPTVTDPICGKAVDPLRARAVGIFGGVTYYFCSAECKSKFKDPRRTARAPDAKEGAKEGGRDRPSSAKAAPVAVAEPPAIQPERAQARPSHALVVEALNTHEDIALADDAPRPATAS